ncbi:hypothetical protein KV395_08735 [Microbacterium luteolum]|uniref:Uncharacterized protein n=1 Tax=Microbacterium luteolum TaxID=69367 RepID=A0ABY7XMG7_MICLT|nr:hypothetical protein [Microbacterium luteolum]WDM43331.1 hypothetical protein KV395_08735 [Microbacterium luteolum]
MTIQEDLRQIIADHRALGDRLESLLENSDWIGEIDDESSWPVFDPETDEPYVRPDINGNRAQLDWVSIMLWSKLAALNARERRGASRQEYIQFSKDAGYRDGRGWNAWSGYLDLSDGRWIDNEDGLTNLRTYYRRQRRAIPADIVAWADAGGFAQ